MRAFVRWTTLLVLIAWAGVAAAQVTPISRYARITGNVNFVATGGTLRAAENNVNPCSVNTTSSQALSGIPAGATIRAAYLYWGGSGSTVDANVTLNGTTIAAQQTFTATVAPLGGTYRYFGGRADVTNRISGNGTMTFGGLSVNTGTPFCGTSTTSTVIAGWSLIVIYERAVEPLRAINIFDGLEFFYGSSVTTVSDGFRIPASGIDGKMAVVTWEGDTTNSTPRSGVAESLTFNGNALADGINVAGSNPAVQEYDSTINTLGLSNAWGVDVDTYNITPFLSPGQTTGTAVYASGEDLVLLTAKVVSVTSEPVVDLTLTKTHSGNFTVGANAAYTLTVANAAGSQPTDFPITVTDTLPAGLTYVSAVGTGWSCGASGQTVTCTHPGILNAGASLPPITLNASVGSAAFPSVVNTAQVSTPSFDPVSANNSTSDTATVLGSNLSTSTKTVQDMNAGDSDPGDTLRYTITLRDTSGVATTGASVTDDVPGNVSNFSVVSVPTGASNTSTGSGTGANGTGRVNITGINVPANGSVTIVFDVQVAAGTSPGATIDNTATIANPMGTGATPSAPQVIVSVSRIPGSGSKPLYIVSSTGATGQLSRTPPAANQTRTLAEGESYTWRLTPNLSTPVTLAAGTMQIPLWLARSGSNNDNRSLQVVFGNTALGTTYPATLATTFTSTAVQLRTLVVTLPGSITGPANSAFTLTITNTSSGNGARDLVVHALQSAGSYSYVSLNSLSVINVNSVATYDAAYPGGATTSSYLRGSTVYVRAVVADPFGSFDIAGADVSILDPASGVQVNAVEMGQVADSGAATRTYQYAFAVPANAAAGAWTIRVVAREGTENTVSDLGVGTFTVTAPMPSLQVTKISQVVSDPVNGGSNPKRIPGSVQMYTITVTNSGAGSVDAASLVVTDAVPANTAMYVNSGGGDPVVFAQGTVASGLTYSYPANVSYSSQPGGGAPYDYTPTPDTNGYDANVRGVRIAPSGAMTGAGGSGNPSFTLQFRVKVN